MLLSCSLKRKVVATCGAILGFTLLYEANILDSQRASRDTVRAEELAKPAPGLKLRFAATAYCKGTTTASGTAVRTGIAAADPDLLPVGSVIQVDSLDAKYNGIYTIMDTGPAVQGREIDIYMWSCHEALAFGRRKVQLHVLRLGWNPRDSSSNSQKRVASLFGARESRAREDALLAAAASPAPAPTPLPLLASATELAPAPPATR
jgi:3D (Asp-Asp-Asp) domain-containing protein